MDSTDRSVPYGYCHCGCGQKAPLVQQTNRRIGRIRGEPHRYITGHNRRRTPEAWEERDCGYETPCWVWLRSLNTNGYGQSKRNGQTPRLAYRVNWEQKHGPVPDGLELDHLCRNRRCVNPDHLEPVSHAENMQRGANARLTREQVKAIRASTDCSGPFLAARYGVGTTTIYNILRGESWKDV